MYGDFCLTLKWWYLPEKHRYSIIVFDSLPAILCLLYSSVEKKPVTNMVKEQNITQCLLSLSKFWIRNSKYFQKYSWPKDECTLYFVASSVVGKTVYVPTPSSSPSLLTSNTIANIITVITISILDTFVVKEINDRKSKGNNYPLQRL